MENKLPHKEKWEALKAPLKEKMFGKTQFLPSAKLSSDIVVKLLFNKELDRATEIANAFDETIKMSDSTDLDCIYLCCRRMADLCQVLDYGAAGAWLGMFCEEVLEDYNDAKYWYNKAASFKNGIGMYRVGLLYLNKKVPLPPQVSLVRCFTDASAHGVAEAKAVLEKYFPQTETPKY